MENNIFLRAKDKFNPDITNKFSSKSSERKGEKFVQSTTIYNPITGVVPDRIKNANDLILAKENAMKVNDVRKMIRQKEEERKVQDTTLKPVKTKVSNQVSYQNINSFNELKANVPQKQVQRNNLLDGLKELGILR